MRSRRLPAALSLLLAILALGIAIGTAASHFPNGLGVLLCLIGSICATWFGMRRTALARTAGLAAAGLLALGALALVILERAVLENLLIVGCVSGMLVAARLAFAPHAELAPGERPSHPVLFYNPRSGGGKAIRFDLPTEARRRGIEPVGLGPGDDLEALVRDAVTRGADALAMAGGDGSQAIVAMVAAEFDLPYACIPAGTRNHFALDLGVDRDDVVGALDALVTGGERRVDLAEVNGRIFVNNVSLGLYADAVQRPGYREAKLHTLLAVVPSALGPNAAPTRLRWRGPHGPQSAVAVLISNNPYRLGRVLGAGTRPRLDQGVLGIAALAPVEPDGDMAGHAALRMEQWTEATFEVSSDGPVAAGIDGEAVQLDPPLRFRIRPNALRVRIAPQHPGASPSALEPEGPWETIEALASLAVRREQPTAAR